MQQKYIPMKRWRVLFQRSLGNGQFYFWKKKLVWISSIQRVEYRYPECVMKSGFSTSNDTAGHNHFEIPPYLTSILGSKAIKVKQSLQWFKPVKVTLLLKILQESLISFGVKVKSLQWLSRPCSHLWSLTQSFLLSSVCPCLPVTPLQSCCLPICSQLT